MLFSSMIFTFTMRVRNYILNSSPFIFFFFYNLSQKEEDSSLSKEFLELTVLEQHSKNDRNTKKSIQVFFFNDNKLTKD